jgi:hypothetical protein
MSSALIYRLTAFAILAAVTGHRFLATRVPVGTEQYHQRIRAASELIPSYIGGWVGHDVPVEARAITVLRPNVILSRNYDSVENGATIGLTFVHCSDVHDMAGHFPPRCYPANGWAPQSSRARDWTIGHLTFTGMEYQFRREDVGRSGQVIVMNCLLLPGNRIVRDMNGLARAVGSVQGQWTGAAQIQIYFHSPLTEEQRDEAIRTLLQGYLPVIEAVLSDKTPQENKS